MDLSGLSLTDEELLNSLFLQLVETPYISRLGGSRNTYDYNSLFFPLGPFDISMAGPIDIGAAAYINPDESQISVTTDISQNTDPLSNFFIPSWEERTHTAPPSTTIRLLEPPTSLSPHIAHLWARDYTLAEWIDNMEKPDRLHTIRLPDGSGGTIDISSSQTLVLGTVYRDSISALFYRNQRNRWLARRTINHWRQRIWLKKPQCGVDLIEMEPVHEADAIYITDTINRAVYKFHRRDIFNCLISNISMADEMLPNPRSPTNPWTNSPFTLAQTITVCQQLITDYARRGRCPPVLFAAFCAAGYCIPHFLSTNLSMLSQYAITAYFKDIHPHNIETVIDTILQLLSAASVNYSPVAMRRWIRQTHITPMHREWLALIRDYTLYINLHIQTRVAWYDDGVIFRDVRRLYSRTRPVDPAGSRIRLTRDIGAARTPPIPLDLTGYNASLSAMTLLFGDNHQPLVLPTLPSLLSYFDISGTMLD
jgi:hypothetical protein